MNIGDLLLRLLVDSSDFERQVIAQGEAAGAKAGTAMGASMAANLSAASGRIGATLGSIGQSMTRTGRSLTTGLTLPIIAAGAAVTHFALDFDTTLRRVVGLTDVTVESIDGIKESILAMAAEVGRSPQELAEAFYFVASAGFEAAEAMDVLETAAKASASGLGDTQTIAQVLGAVINAYGKENITAARAADILVEAVSQGTAEADAFAGVIGRVVPAASAMGVSFDQVAAALAAMTLGGLSAEEAAVGLNQVFVSLLKPTREANDALAAVGLSAEGIRRQLREEGLLATLRTLEDRFAGNETASAAVFGNVRALRTVTNLLNLDTEQLNDVFGKVEDSLGRLETAYEETEGPQRDLDRAAADLEASLASLGEDVLPNVVTGFQSLAAAVREIAKWWKTLDVPTRQFIVNALAVTAAVGPLLIVLGALTRAVGGLFRGFAALLGPKGLVTLPTRLAAAARVAGRVAPWLALVSVLTEIPDAIRGIERAIDGFVSNSPRKVLSGLRLLNNIMAANPWGSAFTAANELVLDEIERQLDQAADHVEGTFSGWGERWGPIVRPIEEATDLIGIVLEDGSIEIGNAADTMVDPIEQAMIDARAKVGEETRGLISDMAGILDTGPEELEDELDAFFEALGEPFTTARRLAVLEGQGARVDWAESFAEGDPQAQAAAFEKFSTEVLDQLELLQPEIFGAGQAAPVSYMEGVAANAQAAIDYLISTPTFPDFVNAFDLADQLEAMGETALAAFVRGAATVPASAKAKATAAAQRINTNLRDGANWYAGGEGVAIAWASGLNSPRATTAAKQAANRLLMVVKPYLIGDSPPPVGPLSTVDEGGAAVAEAWAGGLVAGLRSMVPTLVGAVAQFGDALTVNPAAALAGGIGSYPTTGLTLPGFVGDPGGEVTSIVNNYNLNVTGKIGVDVAQDAVDEMRRLQSFSLASSGRPG